MGVPCGADEGAVVEVVAGASPPPAPAASSFSTISLCPPLCAN